MVETPNPPVNEFPFKFGSKGYIDPDFKDLEFSPQERDGIFMSAYLQGAINVISTQEDYIKECPTYVIGYGQSIQIIKGRCVYGGLRDIAGLITGIKNKESADLPAAIVGDIGVVTTDLPAYITGVTFKDLQGTIRSFVYGDLNAEIGFLWAKELGAHIGAHPPGNLPAYLKVWPERSLPAEVRGWQASNLSGYIKQIWTKDLGATLRPYKWNDINGIVRGWGRSSLDLSASTRGVVVQDLPAFITTTEIKDLIGNIFGYLPGDLGASLHGWEYRDLQGIIIGDDWLYQIQGIINVSGGYVNLPGHLKSILGSSLSNLQASISSYWRTDLAATIYGTSFVDLQGFIDTQRQYSDLAAEIYPKMVRMAAIVSVSTMAHKNLWATINPACFNTMSIPLYAYIRATYKKELTATIHGKVEQWGTSNLASSVGYRPYYYSSIDKLNLNITIRDSVFYRSEDKLPLYIRIFDYSVPLSASIVGIFRSSNLQAAVYGEPILPYDFNKLELVLHFKAVELFPNGSLKQAQYIEFSFEDIVRDYFYVGAEQSLYKTDKIDRWITELASYYPANATVGLKRRLHKATSLFSLKNFSNIDEAVKHHIHYVITDFNSDLRGIINVSGNTKYLGASINSRDRSYSNLFSHITAVS